MIEASMIQKYKSKDIGWLIHKAQEHFNRFVRNRDKHLGCISCANGLVEDAGHFYPSTYSALRFNEWNVNGQCSFNCNKMKSGNIHEYRAGLIKKIGQEKVEWLDNHAHDKIKWDRFELIEIIIKYKNLNKNYSADNQ
jgi:hypothetical protein